ncbi:MAG: DUF4271 domain-containing protein [Bacteroidales bacterium]|jgi:hypothetical protein
MKKDSIIYNPYFLYKDNLNWFGGFLHLQDEVPAYILKVNNDTVFLKTRIVQAKINDDKSFDKSIFSPHLLQSKYSLPKERTYINPGWTSILIISCLLLFAIAQYGYFKRMLQIFKAFFTNRFFNQFSRDGGLFTERVSLFLFISYIFAFSLFIFNSYRVCLSIPAFPLLDIIIYIKILGAVLVFYLIKMGLFNFSGYIFKANDKISDYVLTLYLFGQVTGVCLLPIIILTNYFDNKIMLYAGFIIILMLYIYFLFRSFVIALTKSKVSTYYIFLYLCTLEILPLVLLVKIFRISIS